MSNVVSSFPQCTQDVKIWSIWLSILTLQFNLWLVSSTFCPKLRSVCSMLLLVNKGHPHWQAHVLTFYLSSSFLWLFSAVKLKMARHLKQTLHWIFHRIRLFLIVFEAFELEPNFFTLEGQCSSFRSINVWSTSSPTKVLSLFVSTCLGENETFAPNRFFFVLWRDTIPCTIAFINLFHL